MICDRLTMLHEMSRTFHFPGVVFQTRVVGLSVSRWTRCVVVGTRDGGWGSHRWGFFEVLVLFASHSEHLWRHTLGPTRHPARGPAHFSGHTVRETLKTVVLRLHNCLIPNIPFLEDVWCLWLPLAWKIFLSIYFLLFNIWSIIPGVRFTEGLNGALS